MNSKSYRYQCVIFDCDGVLVDSEPIGNKVMVDMANALGANIDLDYAYQYFKGNSLYECMKIIEHLIDEELPSYFESEYRRISFQRFEQEIKPVEGVVDVLRSLTIPFCVASSGPMNKIRLNLELTGLLPFFEDKVFSCYSIKKWKPDPEIFIWAAKSMGFDISECIVIEDSIHGVEAALNGGFDVFAFTAHDINNALKERATKTFNNMQGLKELLNI